MSDHRRRVNFVAALGFLRIPPRAPELQLLHRWLDTWTGVGLVVVGVERQGLRFSLSHIGEANGARTYSPHLMIRRFFCLPDTIDPRGPKGK